MNEKYPLALPEGTVLAGQYIVERVLGQGGFGITYEAKDHKTGERVAVKEFFPDAMATRTDQTTVMPFSGEKGDKGHKASPDCPYRRKHRRQSYHLEKSCRNRPRLFLYN